MDVRLPNLGEGADSGTVVSLLVKEGDSISSGQNLIEVETGKAVVAVPSPVAGQVGPFRVKAGDKITVGQVFVTVGGAGTVAPSEKKPAAESASVAVARAGERKTSPDRAEEAEEPAAGLDDFAPKSPFPPPASPSLRKIAAELGIDLSRVKGSESGGRIVMADVRVYIERLQTVAAAPPKAASKPAPPSAPVDFAKWGPVSRKPMTQLRKTISHRMVEAWTTIPHVTQFDEADISEIMVLRKKFKAAYEAQGASLTVTVFVLKALVDTLKQHPSLNSSIDEAAKEIVFKDYFHFGIAVDTEGGLIVPVIRDVDEKSMLQLAKDLAGVAAKTRDRKVTMDDLTGGTFTISNQGGIGGAHFTPIVNKPEVAILGLGRGLLKPIVKNGKIEAATMLPLCLSYDHRLIDGGTAARFIKDLLTALEGFKDEAVKQGVA